MPARIRVVTLVDTLYAAGGAERLAVQITQGLDPERFERTLVATRKRKDAPFVDELEAAGVRVLQLERRGKLDVTAWRPLLAELRRTDVVHAHKFGSNVWAAVFGSLLRVPVIVTHEHTWSYVGQPLRRFLDRELIARRSSAFIAVSRDDERKMIEIERVRPAKIRFLPNGIPPLPAPSGKDVRAELGLRPDAPVLLSVGLLRPQKALEVLVEAAAILRDEFPGVRVLIAGIGPEENKLRARMAALDVEDNVVLLGKRRDVPDLLAIADVCVSSSDFEGSPLAVMEYMAARKPVVATTVGGVPDLIEEGVHGFLVPPRDPKALAERAARLLRSPELRAELGANAQARQREEFDLDAMVRRVEALYLELLAAAPRRRRTIASS